MKPKKKASGGKSMKDAGRSLVWVTFDEDSKTKVRMAAAKEGIPMSQFLAKHGLAAAEKILGK